MAALKELKTLVSNLFNSLSKVNITAYRMDNDDLPDGVSKVGLNIITKQSVAASLFESSLPASKQARLCFSIVIEYDGYNSGITRPDLASIKLSDHCTQMSLLIASENSYTPAIHFIDKATSTLLLPVAFQAFVENRGTDLFYQKMRDTCDEHVDNIKQMPF